MRLKIYPVLLLIAVCAITSCKKGNSPTPKPTPKSDTDIYISGSMATAGGQSVATYWKNGVAVKLADSSANSEARSIAIRSNGDIYLTGYILGTSDQTNQSAAYWKNGVVSRLDNGPYYSDAFGIAFVGSDIYINGIVMDNGFMPSAFFWKNGVETPLPLGWTGSDAFAMATNGTNVFFAGDSRKSSTTYQWFPTYWKNNGSATLLDPTNQGVVYGVAVNGNDIYTVGNTDVSGKSQIACYWKNGVIAPLTDGSSYAEAYAITVSGADVYTAGDITFNGKTSAAYWKNNTLVTLGDGSAISYAQAITVVGSNVYVAGLTHDKNGNINACYWKNGVLNVLPQDVAGKSTALGIAIVPH